MHPRQQSGELARRTLNCLMAAHDQCKGVVPGGVAQNVRCLCDCHDDQSDGYTKEG